MLPIAAPTALQRKYSRVRDVTSSPRSISNRMTIPDSDTDADFGTRQRQGQGVERLQMRIWTILVSNLVGTRRMKGFIGQNEEPPRHPGGDKVSRIC